ncbi:transposase [Thermoanaerobacter uzonensis]|uniref:transposase n=1 Tax=Thermoanaerobacter uzonensis TaxID=447593 RepID=UPI0022ABE1B6|nr:MULTISPECIES: transposase [Thermoanaerobacter]
MAAQATEQVKAEPYERTEERQDYHNSYYSRSLITRVGTLTSKVPRLRSGKFTIDLFNRCQRSEQTLLLVLMEMIVDGVSTRKIEGSLIKFVGLKFRNPRFLSFVKISIPLLQHGIQDL